MMSVQSLLQALREPFETLGLKSDDGGDAFQVEALVGDGSDRRFYRLRHGSTRLVVLCSAAHEGSGVGENHSYLRIGLHLLDKGLPVPRILWADAARGFFVLEDLGDCHVEKLARRSILKRRRLYGKLLKLLVNLHHRARHGFEESFCFDGPVYNASFIYTRELEYFRKAFLIGCLSEEIDGEDLRHDFENLAEAGEKCPRSLVFHRDFQSRNVMIAGGELRLIDFQGMRFGPPTYDLASTLLDPYVELDADFQKSIVLLYWKLTRGLWNYRYTDFKASYEAVRLCRNLQVLGAYGFLGLEKGKKHFLKYIPGAWGRLIAWLTGPLRGRFPKLEKKVRNISKRKGMLVKTFE